MTRRAPRNSATTAIAIVAPLALLVASAGLSWRVSARSVRDAQSPLKTHLTSPRADEFNIALAALVSLDEKGTLDLWEAALANPAPQLRSRAWSEYRTVQSKIVRNELVPQVARIGVRAESILRLANEHRLQLSVWSSDGNQTVAAASPRLIERLRSAGIRVDVVYDSIAEWQKARAQGDGLAREITPDYQSAAAPQTQVRIAVIDLSDHQTGPGRAVWLGDRENILMREGSLVAYLDVFQSDGSDESIDSHISDEYTGRGFKLAGFFRPEEFADAAPKFFHGKSFDAGRRTLSTKGAIQATLADGGFHSYDEARTEFKALADSHPDLAQYVKLGTSFEGREIFALKITRGAAIDDPSKPDVLITGCHHAREWISVESPVYFANQLITGYTANDHVKHLVDNLQIWVVPIVNPDGLTFSQGSPNDSFDIARLWRKNRRPFTFGNCLSTVGVDLNRNYPFQWRLEEDNPCTDYCVAGNQCINDDIGASDNPVSEIYRGPASASEPEVKAIRSLMDDPNRRFRAQLDYHNYSQVILYPWGYQQHETPDASTLSRLAQRMSDDMRAVTNTIYHPEQAIDLYATTGTSTDHAYGTNRVAAAFVVEMRPNCCDFTVPERDILEINRENWAGALAVLRWAAGPPILESVKAYSFSADGSFSKLVYSARWTDPEEATNGPRQLVIDTRFPGIEEGPVQLHLQFSKPMSTSLPARATLSRSTNPDELNLVAVGASEGWQKSVYQDDTWIGETVITQDEDLSNAWRLRVSANDAVGLDLDGRPGSVATYATGTGKWQDYEDSNNTGSVGGADNEHVLPPTLRGNLLNIFVAKPGGSERLAAGDAYTVAWTLPKGSGFVPVQQELLLSTDGGASFAHLAMGLPGALEEFPITLPAVATTRARVRVLAIEGSVGNTLVGNGLSDFTVGANVGSAIDISFVSSEKVGQNWADTSSSNTPQGSSGALRLIIDLKVTNRASATIVNPFLRIAELNRGNVLLTRDPSSRPAEGALQTIDAGGDNALSPGETVLVRLVVGLVKKKKFQLSLTLFGVPLTGSINPAPPITVWDAKPKSK
ncbi:MAG: M14 family metallopeptidase [Blastocatellia bacterium]